jgi:hypothetical protein
LFVEPDAAVGRHGPASRRRLFIEGMTREPVRQVRKNSIKEAIARFRPVPGFYSLQMLAAFCANIVMMVVQAIRMNNWITGRREAG